MDVFAAACAWSVIETPAVPFLTSDAGFLFLPSLTGGALLIPLSPHRALFIERGTPTLGGPKVRVARQQWSAADVRLINDALIVSAGREVYARDQEQADRASDIMRESVQPSCDGRGVSPTDLRPLAVQGTSISFPQAMADPAGQVYQALCEAHGVYNKIRVSAAPSQGDVTGRLRRRVAWETRTLQTITAAKKFLVATPEGLQISHVPFGKPVTLLQPPEKHLTTSGD